MFGIGMQELVLVLLIALVVIGPRKLPEVARALGKGYGEFRRAFDDMKRSVETEVRADEIRRTLLDLPPPLPPQKPSETRPAPLVDTTPPASPYPETVDGSPPPPEPPSAGKPSGDAPREPEPRDGESSGG